MLIDRNALMADVILDAADGRLVLGYFHCLLHVIEDFEVVIFDYLVRDICPLKEYDGRRTRVTAAASVI